MIQLFNDWFDLHNSSHKYDHGRPSFGLDIINQKNLLLEMNEFISKMTVHGKKRNITSISKRLISLGIIILILYYI